MAPKPARTMYGKILATKAANEAARLTEEARRAADPFEDSKRALQKLGYNVYPESILGGDHFRSKHYRVGRLRLTREELVAYAAKLTGE